MKVFSVSLLVYKLTTQTVTGSDEHTLTVFSEFYDAGGSRVQTSTYTDCFYPGDILSFAFAGYEDYRSPPVCEFTSLCLQQHVNNVCLQCERFML